MPTNIERAIWSRQRKIAETLNWRTQVCAEAELKIRRLQRDIVALGGDIEASELPDLNVDDDVLETMIRDIIVKRGVV